MKWLTINTWAYKKQAKECWHIWFAWHPVCVKKYPDGAKERVWLQNVKRKGREWHGMASSGWEYKYKEL